MPSPSKTPYLDSLLADSNVARAGGMGTPDYGVQVLIAFVKDFFLDATNSSGRFITIRPDSPDSVKAGKYLKVTEYFAWDEDAPDHRDKVVIGYRGVQYQPTGMTQGLEKFNFLTGVHTRRYLGSCRFDAMCYSRGGPQARRLAEYIQTMITIYSPELRGLMQLVKLGASSIGQETTIFPPSGSSRQELMMVPVTVEVILGQSFVKTPYAPKVSPMGLIVEDQQTKTVIDEVGVIPPDSPAV
jgi:hypothetical protein